MALTIITNPVSLITTTTATCGGNSISTPTGTITAKGVCWANTVNPIATGNHLDANLTTYPSNSNFPISITGLTSGATYYVRAYVTETISGTPTTYYGANVVFTTLGLTTTAATSITSTTATSGATSVNGFTSVSSVGVCWSTSINPTTSNNKTIDILTGNSFISNLTGLTPGTTYYVRSYIVSNGTTYYGNEITFPTSSTLPTVTTTQSITSITSTGATVSGNVSSTGGLTVTVKGIQWSLNSNMSSPTDVSSGSGGTGTYSVTLSGLTSGLTYYVRAYATNSNGTSYGAIYNFTTLGGPTVETVIPYSITSNTAQSGCNVLNIGGSSLTARGVVISTNPFPTLATGTVFTDSYPGNGSQYLVKLTGLTKDTTYYIRAYAINSQGTGYGEEELIFSTTSCNPLIEDCNPQEFPTVACTDTACEYIISAECVVGNEITPPTSCNIITTQTDLINSLIQINNNLCNISSKDFAIFILGSIINNPSLNTVFCYLKNITCEG